MPDSDKYSSVLLSLEELEDIKIALDHAMYGWSNIWSCDKDQRQKKLIDLIEMEIKDLNYPNV